jgi:hypothetical protein
MISKFDGRCCFCGRDTRAGVDTYDLETKKSYHEECREMEASKPDPEAFKLADRLGFEPASKTKGLFE